MNRSLRGPRGGLRGLPTGGTRPLGPLALQWAAAEQPLKSGVDGLEVHCTLLRCAECPEAWPGYPLLPRPESQRLWEGDGAAAFNSIPRAHPRPFTLACINPTCTSTRQLCPSLALHACILPWPKLVACGSSFSPICCLCSVGCCSPSSLSLRPGDPDGHGSMARGPHIRPVTAVYPPDLPSSLGLVGTASDTRDTDPRLCRPQPLLCGSCTYSTAQYY